MDEKRLTAYLLPPCRQWWPAWKEWPEESQADEERKGIGSSEGCAAENPLELGLSENTECSKDRSLGKHQVRSPQDSKE